MAIFGWKEAGYRTSGWADPDGGHEDFQVLVAPISSMFVNALHPVKFIFLIVDADSKK